MSDNFNEFEDYSDVTKLKWWEKIRDVFIDPKKLFKSLKFYPNLKLSISVIVITTLLTAFLQINSEEFINNVLKSMGGPTPSGSTLNAYVYITIALIPLVPLFVIFFKSFMISGLAVLAGGDSDYTDAMVVTTYAYIPVAVGTLLLAVIAYLSGTNPIELSLAQILPESMAGGLIYGIALRMDILVIWYQVLSLIGTSYIFEISRKKALIPVILPWAIWIIFSAGLHVLSYGGVI